MKQFLFFILLIIQYSNSFCVSQNNKHAFVSSQLNAAVKTDEQKETICKILEDSNQKHILEYLENNDDTQKLQDQILALNKSYPGGIEAYVNKAVELLSTETTTSGTIKFAAGEDLKYGDLGAYEEIALSQLAHADSCAADGVEATPLGFVIVAGGLGERLGYSGIKLSLSSTILTQTGDEMCYLEYYCRYILALEAKLKKISGKVDIKLPLIIMTSGDTHASTVQLLAENNNFDLSENQVHILQQDKVPAITDKTGRLDFDEVKGEISTKPHGHGDVHHLLYKSGLLQDFSKRKMQYLVFLQDTNALVTSGLLATIGVSVKKGFVMNTLTVPRVPGEAAGAIAILEEENKAPLTINIEYNLLDPMLSAQNMVDEADPDTGYSKYPGNTNNLVLEFDAYQRTILNSPSQGIVSEFVNPKYADEAKTIFKKPTRLECMMQDVPYLLVDELGNKANIGFTQLERWVSFSPAKNALEGASGAHPGTLSSAESDLFVYNQNRLKHAGVIIEEGDAETFEGIEVTGGPRVLVNSDFGLTQKDLEDKLQGENKISARSTLLIQGEDITIKNLTLDGALVIKVVKGASLEVNSIEVQNDGWRFKGLTDEEKENSPEEVTIRGYTLDKIGQLEVSIKKPGQYVLNSDGTVSAK